MFTAAFIAKIEREEDLADIVTTLDRQSLFLTQLARAIRTLRAKATNQKALSA